MQNRNPSAIEIVKQYIEVLNHRFLRERNLPAYNSETKHWNTGQFYLHESIGKFGYVYELREVLDESGSFKVHGSPNGYKADELALFLDGWIIGHYRTLDMLNIVLSETDAEGEIVYQDGVGYADGPSFEEDEEEEGEEKEEADIESAPEDKNEKQA